MKTNKNNFIDLFCGAGGLSLGFERAGYECVGAIDNSKACIDTHKLNFPNCISMGVQIRTQEQRPAHGVASQKICTLTHEILQSA